MREAGGLAGEGAAQAWVTNVSVLALACGWAGASSYGSGSGSVEATCRSACSFSWPDRCGRRCRLLLP